MSASIETDLFPDVPSIRDLAAGALFLRGPVELIVAWGVILAFAIVSSSIGLIATLLLVPVAIFMIAIGFLWLGFNRLR